jgi:hypothetical protein
LEEIAKELVIKIARPEDFLNALVSMKHLERVDDRYKNTPETAAFCVRASRLYIGEAFSRFGNLATCSFARLTDQLHELKPRYNNFNELYKSN